MEKWSFPTNDAGQVKGVADAGIENFNGNELSSLARENCQNSLDAAENNDNPNVRVEFERYLVNRNQIPGVAEYSRILIQCKSFWATSKSEKTKDFINKAIQLINEEKSFALRISDYNTTGLSSPYKFDFDGWNSLTKIDGGANKGDDKAGAFGIGKSAPFSNSACRLVFYRTFNQDGEKAAQGVSRIVSYRNSESKITAGIGYYGSPIDNMPVQSIDELDSLNKREKHGTDVFVFGFKNSSDWQMKMIVSILDSFLMSIFTNKLSVILKEKETIKEINKNSLEQFMIMIHRQKPEESLSTYGNYLALTKTGDNVYSFSKNFHSMGTLELKLLIDQNEKLDKKILIVRKAGMKLFRLGNLSKLVSFTGVLELKGLALNQYFRKMETVAHDNWETGRHDNPKQAKEYFEEIKTWIRETIANIVEHSSSEEIDVEGLGGVLQKDSFDKDNENTDNKQESLNNHLGQIEIISKPVSPQAKGLFYGQGEHTGKTTTNVNGSLGKTGFDAIRTLKGQRTRTKLESHKGEPNKDGKDIVKKQNEKKSKNFPLEETRIIKTATGTYIVSFKLPKDVRVGVVELVAIGENGKSNKIQIKDVKIIEGLYSTYIKDGTVTAMGMSSKGKVKMQVTLYDSHDYAMEVNVYEHN